MIIFVIALATAAAAPLPLNPTETDDVRCIVTAATARPPVAPAWLATRARELLVVSGADIMDRTGRTREQVAALLQGEVERQKTGPGRPDAEAIRQCAGHVERRMQAEAASDPLPLPLPTPNPR